MKLNGKVGIVTGAGRGLGRAYAEALAAEGASVVVNDLDEDALSETVSAIRQTGGAAVGVVAAVGSAEVGTQLVEAAISEFGRLDFVVANAGVLRDASALKLTEANFRIVLETHLLGAFFTAQPALARFKEQGEGGRVILIGSPAGQSAAFGQSNYSAAKAGIAGLGRTLALEAKRLQVTVNVVVPVALTRMTATIPGLAEIAEEAAAGGPVPRVLREAGMGVPADVAPLIAYLISDQAANITGQVFGIGGDRLSLWSQPQEVDFALKDGGWTFDDIAEIVPRQFTAQLQNFLPAPFPSLDGTK